jgi:phosphohistidine swiveling domain-containing protein
VTAGWEGREVTVDGSGGVVYRGVLPTESVRSEDVPGLDLVVEWARELCPVAVVDDAPESLNLDEAGLSLDPDADAELLIERLRGAPAVAGSILTTSAGARAVLQSGVPVVVRLPSQHAEVLLLALVQAGTQS